MTLTRSGRSSRQAPHGRADLDGEGLAERWEVGQRPVDPVGVGSVHVDIRQHPPVLLGVVHPPDRGVGDEEALLRAQAGEVHAVIGRRVQEGVVCDGETSQVGDVLAQGETPIDVLVV